MPHLYTMSSRVIWWKDLEPQALKLSEDASLGLQASRQMHTRAYIYIYICEKHTMTLAVSITA